LIPELIAFRASAISAARAKADRRPRQTTTINAPADKDWLEVFKDAIASGKARVLQDA
jgi:hypothetical protein